MEQYICRETFSITGLTIDKRKKDKKVTIKEGEILKVDKNGNILRDDMSIINMNSIIAQYYLKKVE